MRTNRREFIATTAGALATLRASGMAAQTKKRQLRITFEGLAVIAVSKDIKAVAGLPGTSPRVDILFLSHAEHTAPTVIQIGNPTEQLSLQDSYLVIKVNKKDLATPIDKESATPGVGLDATTESPCAHNNWKGLKNLPQFERILSSRVDVLSSELGNSPAHLSGRVTLRRGILAGEFPISKYAQFQWAFPGGPKDYVQEFTDHTTWVEDIEEGELILEAVPFAGGTARTFEIKQTGNVALVIGSGRTTTPTQTKVADHFAHYYQVLDYNGKVKPIPEQAGAACPKQKPPTFTVQQDNIFKQIKAATDRLRPMKQEEECGATEVLRGEPGICLNGIAYSTAV